MAATRDLSPVVRMKSGLTSFVFLSGRGGITIRRRPRLREAEGTLMAGVHARADVDDGEPPGHPPLPAPRPPTRARTRCGAASFGGWHWNVSGVPGVSKERPTSPHSSDRLMNPADTHADRRSFLLRSSALLAAAVLGGASPAWTQARGRRGGAGGFPHPEPRRGITAAKVLADETLGGNPEVLAAYAAAREFPEVFDGIYCVCRCQRNLGHRSLLSCYESRQPTGCMGCREVADFVARRARQGESLATIRAAVDHEWS